MSKAALVIVLVAIHEIHLSEGIVAPGTAFETEDEKLADYLLSIGAAKSPKAEAQAEADALQSAAEEAARAAQEEADRLAAEEAARVAAEEADRLAAEEAQRLADEEAAAAEKASKRK